MPFGNDPTPETGFSAVRETSEKFAALRNLTRTIFREKAKALAAAGWPVLDTAVPRERVAQAA
jgi:hypothetical protein